ncbi:hypothetical protein T484DRAFT_3434009 [Baffinella frigidus]|nr:hypothetical protein T484DRAFT_3434009 [Cryptophyta sp. CCMP2293]
MSIEETSYVNLINPASPPVGRERSERARESRRIIPGTNFIIPGRHLIIPGTDCIIPGTNFIIPDAHLIIPGTDCIIPGTNFIITGTNFTIPGTNSDRVESSRPYPHSGLRRDFGITLKR